MAEGPGIYDDLCTYVREKSEAAAVILIVLDGNKGSGFSAQSYLEETTEYLPALLERIARDMRAGVAQ